MSKILSMAALLRVQFMMVKQFNLFAARRAEVADDFKTFGLIDTLEYYNLDMPTPEIQPRLYDEVPAGVVAFYRFGDASIDYLSGENPIWSIQQDIESHVDPVRGRALVVAMADVFERAFAPTNRVDEPLFHPDDFTAVQVDGEDQEYGIVVSDITPSDARIGYSEGGLTYQAIITYDLIVQADTG